MTVSIILTGFTAIVSQIVFIRELLVVFYGNELSVAFILASWLIGGAMGSLLLGRFADNIKHARAAFAGCQLTLSIILPLNILFIRSIKSVIGVNPGEIIPFFPMVAASFIILVPACAIIGFLFSLGCRIFEDEKRPGAALIGKVYVLEACGAILGGLLASFLLVRLLSSVMIMAAISLLLAATAAFLLYPPGRSRGMRSALAAAVAIFAAVAIAFPGGLWKKFDRSSLAKQWRGYELLASGNSIYGNIALARNISQYSFFNNGLHLYTVPDRQASEEAVHFAMLEHPDPKNVLLIGGGVGGLAEEVLKHPVEKVDYVELDPMILHMAKEYLPRGYYKALEDLRISLHFVDGRAFIKRPPRQYDVIIIDLGDPYTAQMNRFYTAEFFNEAKKAMRKGGVLSFGLSSSESYMSKELRGFLSSIYATCVSAFADVKVIPGETACFLVSDDKGSLTYDQKVLMRRATERGLDLKYVREYYLSSRLSSVMVSFTENSIAAGAQSAGVNRDLRPISYYYDMVFWAARFKGSVFTRVLRSANARRVLWPSMAAVLLIVAIGILGGVRKGALRRAAVTAVLANGFSQMAFQVITLLSFQIIYGFMFYKVGFIITTFMAGLALGGWRGIRALPGLKDDRYALMVLQAGLCVYAAAILPVFRYLSGLNSGFAAWAGSNIVFAILPLVSGFIGGYLFPLANKIFLGGRRGIGASGGFTYGADLVGAFMGALLIGTFFIPILGIPATCYITVAVNAAALAVSAFSQKREAYR